MFDEPSVETSCMFPLYARQFVCEPICARCAQSTPFTPPDSFATQYFGDSYAVHVHPQLPVTHMHGEETEIFLLGFFLDPLKPELGQVEIAQSFLEAASIDEVVQKVEGLTGRFLLFFKYKAYSIVLADACGLRQLHYYKDAGGGLWCFSQPGLVREALGLVPAPDAQRFWEHASELSNGAWWPGNATLFAGVKRLLPNHYLQLTDGNTRRFWPVAPLERRDDDEILEATCGLLRGGIKAALLRAPLALPITAGIDSRILLAAARPLIKDLYVYTMRYAAMPEDHEDLAIARRLTEIAGISWKVLPCPKEMHSDFQQRFAENCVGARPACGVLAQGLCEYFPKEHWCVKGNGSEVTRCKYYLFGRPIPARRVTGALLCNLYNMEGSPFAAARFQEWLAEALPICNVADFAPTDLFYWEQFMGCWQAMSQLEWDIAMETITPYNNRLLLATMLAMPDRYRCGPQYQFHHDLIQRMWPELLSVPFNPSQARCRIRAKSALHDMVRLSTSFFPRAYYPMKKMYRLFVPSRRWF